MGRMSGVRARLGRIFAPARLVCIGHSHSETIAAAAAQSGTDVDVLNFWHMPDPFVEEDGRRGLAPVYRARLLAPVFSLVGGAVHQDVGLVRHPRPFDFILPMHEDLPVAPDCEIIPYGAMRAAMQARTQPYLDIMTMVRQAVDGAVHHLESPPTFDAETLPADDPGFYHLFGQDAAFSPAWLRFKLWRVHSAIVAAHCRGIGMTFIAHPPQAVTAEGFLRREFAGTPAHANAAYGALMLAQMRRAAKTG
jgi:hypothetical protein